ncbi:alpha-pore-forming cytotoxin subunit MakB [Actinomadura geliboluensis]|uniref:alpha-pore-forming cytotoxin subunit MakB n=1 Tax=Actinomadura geliboluensis TaxID=882440 RepID=UPI003718B2E2
MLCPDVNNICDDLAEAYSAIVRVDAFAHAGRHVSIGYLSPDPGWAQPVRDELGLLGGAGGKWQLDRPDIWSGILAPFRHYRALFAGAAEAAPGLGGDTENWLRLLDGLHSALAGYRTATTIAEYRFDDHMKTLANVQSILHGRLEPVWEELQRTEAGMLALAAEITRLQDRIDQLQANIDSIALWQNWDFTKSAMSISYTLASAGGGIPFLSIGGMLYTVGKTAYDVVKNDAEIDAAIAAIVRRRGEMAQEVQAAAMTKAVLRLIYHFDAAVARIRAGLPKLDRMWAAEAGKVAQVATALRAGARPGELTELAALRPALATWAQLAEFTDRIDRTEKTGKPVTISTEAHTLETA